MRFETLVQTFGRAVGEAMARAGRFEFRGDGEEAGVRLADLDTNGAAPDRIKVALGASDLVHLRIGDSFTVRAEGDEEDALRFALAGGTLKIMRRRGTSGGARRIAITMPAVREIAIGGAGTVEAEAMDPDGAVAIGGAGTVRIARIEGGRLKARIGGSGMIGAAGRLDELSLAIGGSGKAEFACDGDEVEARIGGVGDIVVHGQPRVSLKAGGAGKLRCVPRDTAPPTSQAA